MENIIIINYILSLILGIQSVRIKKYPIWSNLCFLIGFFNFVFATCGLLLLRLRLSG